MGTGQGRRGRRYFWRGRKRGRNRPEKATGSLQTDLAEIRQQVRLPRRAPLCERNQFQPLRDRMTTSQECFPSPPEKTINARFQVGDHSGTTGGVEETGSGKS